MPAKRAAAKMAPARKGSIIGAGEPRVSARDEEVPETLMDLGDSIEVSISTFYKQKGIEAWFKVGTVVHLRPDETPEECFARGQAVTLGGIAEAIETYTDL